MTYEELVDKMDNLVNELYAFQNELSNETDYLSADKSDRIFLAPSIIWDNVLDDLQYIVEENRER